MSGSETPLNGYGRVQYWEERYASEDTLYEWYVSYKSLKDLLAGLITPDSRILVLGCGNSRFSADLYGAGFPNVVNVDISEVCIAQMKERYKHLTAMTWQVMNCAELDFPEESFDLAIDKGTMDAILCGEDAFGCVYRMHQHVQRVLRTGGHLITVSHGDPPSRLDFFSRRKLHWEVKHCTIPKEHETQGDTLGYHVYITMKRMAASTPPETPEEPDDDAEVFAGAYFGSGKARAGRSTGIYVADADVAVADLPTLVALLQAGPGAVREQAATVLWGLAVNDHSVADLVAAGAVPPLVALLADGSPEAKAKAAATLGNLAVDPTGATEVGLAGAIPPLVALLSDGPAMAVAHACGTLANLAADDANAQQLIGAGAVPPLVRVLEAGSWEAQEAAAGALWNLSSDVDVALALVALGAVPPLVHLLCTSTAEARTSAAGVLQNVACLGAECQAAVVALGAVPALVGLLSTGSTEAAAAAAGALACLADGNAAVQPAVVAVGLLPALRGPLRNGTWAVQENTARLLALLGANPDLRPALFAADLFPLLVALLPSTSVDVGQKASDAVLSLAGLRRTDLGGPTPSSLANLLRGWSHKDPDAASADLCAVLRAGEQRTDNGSGPGDSPPSKRARIDSPDHCTGTG